MAEYLTTDTELTSIADAIRSKGGTSDALTYPTEFIDAINAIETTPATQSKTISPTEAKQTVLPDTNYLLSSVTVNAIPSDYVGSDVPTRSSSNLSVSGAVVSVPSGYYAVAAQTTIASGSAKTPAVTITSTPTITLNSANGSISVSYSGSSSITPTVTAGYISSGTTGTVSISGSSSLQLSTQAAATINPTESVQTAVASGKYTTGIVTVGAISSNYVGSNIPVNPTPTASGKTVTIPVGYYNTQTTKDVATTTIAKPTISVGANGLITASITQTAGYVSADNSSDTLQLSTQAAKTVNPTESEQTAVASGKYTTGIVKVGAIPSDYIGSAISTVDVVKGTTTVSGTTATRGDATWSAGLIQAGSMGAATFANSSSGQTQYVDISNTSEAPVLVSGGYLYINKGYTDDLKISLKKLVPDGASADLASDKILSGYSAYNNDGTLIAGNILSKGATIYYTSSSDQVIEYGKYLSGNQTIKAVTTSNISAANIKDGVTVKVGDIGDDDRIVGVTGTFTDASTVTAGQTAAASGQLLQGYSAWVDGAEVKGNITTKTSSNVSASGSTVTVPSGYYATQVTKNVSAGSATTPATTITKNPTISVSASGLITAAYSGTQNVTPTVSSGYVSSGTAGTITVNGSNTYELPTTGTAIITPTETVQNAVLAGTYAIGNVVVAAISSTYVGSGVATQSATTYTPSSATQTIPSGVYLTGVQTIEPIPISVSGHRLIMPEGLIGV